jgi:hypothetical protein
MKINAEGRSAASGELMKIQVNTTYTRYCRPAPSTFYRDARKFTDLPLLKSLWEETG